MGIIFLLEGPVFCFVLSLCIVGFLTRLVLFFFRMVRGNRKSDGQLTLQNKYLNIGRSFFPLHKGITKKPIYAGLWYVLHVCLLVVPVWFSGHIILWEESDLEWFWTALPDEWIDGMTLVLLCLFAYFLIRRIVVSNIRHASSLSDYAFVLIVALPFMTGYLLKHGTFADFVLLGNNMFTIHIISGEILLVVVAFLFWTSRIQVHKCTGCAACTLCCPTEALSSTEENSLRMLNYSNYKCISCAACVVTCPEDAVELRHEISLRRMFQVLPTVVREVELETCEECRQPFIPIPQLSQLLLMTSQKNLEIPLLNICPNCRTRRTAADFRV